MRSVPTNRPVVFRHVLVPILSEGRVHLIGRDVGVKNGRITRLTEPNSLKIRKSETLVIEDGGNDILSTGVADTHSHESLVLPHCAPFPSMADASQGITHSLLGQDGLAPYPTFKGRYVPYGSVTGLEWAINQLDAMPPRPQWQTTGEYANYIHQSSLQNTRVLIPYQTLRIQATGEGEQARALKIDEKLMLKSLIRSDFERGCVGVSLALEYTPGLYLQTPELIELGKIIAEYNQENGTRFPIVVHMRSESDKVEEAVDEMLEIARQSGVPIHISHLKTCQLSNVYKTEGIIAKLEAARAEGLDIVADQHPYEFGSTFLAACLPQHLLAGNLATQKLLLEKGSEFRRTIIAMLEDMDTQTAWAHWIKWAGGPSGVVMVGLPNPNYNWCEGKSIAQAAEKAGQDPFEWFIEAMLANNFGGGQINFNNTRSNVRMILNLPWVGLGSDNVPGKTPHPRRYGAVGRILGEEVRLGTLTLEQAIYKLCFLPKARLWGESGNLEVGGRADLFLFDPNTIAETATVPNPRRLCTGVRITMLGGLIVYDREQPNQPDELY